MTDGCCWNCDKNLNNEGAGTCFSCGNEFCDNCLQETVEGILCSDCIRRYNDG